MNISFVHCWIKSWWALDVLQELIQNEKENTDKQDSQISVFCLFSDREYLEVWSSKIKIITSLPSFLNKFFTNIWPKIPFFWFFFDYRNLLPFYPILIKILGRRLSKFNYDKIVISSFAVSKNIKFDHTKKSLLYLHSPMQYIWTHYEDYVSNLKWIKRPFFVFFAKYLQKRDKQITSFDKIVTNSKYTKQISSKLYWYKNIEVEYPSIDEIFLTGFPLSWGWQPVHHSLEKGNLIQFEIKDYFVFVGRVANLIRDVDKVIELCNTMKVHLLVIWDWPDVNYCKKLAWPTITFISRISDKSELASLVWQSRWLINLSKESLWLWTIQALCLWVPVFGYDWWWTAELVWPESGILVQDKKPKTLIKGFQQFIDTSFDRGVIREKIIYLIS